MVNLIKPWPSWLSPFFWSLLTRCLDWQVLKKFTLVKIVLIRRTMCFSCLEPLIKVDIPFYNYFNQVQPFEKLWFLVEKTLGNHLIIYFLYKCHKNIKWLHGALLPQCFSLNTQNIIKIFFQNKHEVST